MAGEVSTRQWWLIVRRDGHVVGRVKLSIPLLREQTDLDPLVGPLPFTKDFELVDYEAQMPADDQDLFVNYEVIATTSNFEITNVE